MAELIVHAGFPKCGSTSIFNQVRRQIPDLAAAGIAVFNREMMAVSDAGPVQPPLWTLEAALKDDDAARAVRGRIDAALDAAGPGARLILSSENLANDRFPKRVFAGLDARHAVTVVFYIRPQVDWIPSAWKQWDMKQGQKLRQTLARCLSGGRPAYGRIITAWERALPRARIVLRPLIASELAGHSPTTDFLHLLGVAPVAAEAETASNPSVDYALLHLMMRHHALFFTGRHDSAFMHRLVSVLPPEYLRTNAPMLNQAEADAIHTRFRDETIDLVRRHLPGQEAGAFVDQHFGRQDIAWSYSELPEKAVLNRARKIIEATFGFKSTPGQLAMELHQQVMAATGPQAIGADGPLPSGAD